MSPTDPPDPDHVDPASPPPTARGAGSPRVRRRWVWVVVVVAVLLVPVLIVGGWYWYQVDPPGDPGRAVRVTIPRGAGVSQIGDRLAGANVIGSALAFSIYTRVNGHDSFQAGKYRMRRDSGVSAAVATLEAGPQQHYVSLALPPGLRFDEIAARIGALPGRSADRVLELANTGEIRSKFQPAGVNSLEGLTWPDTYAIADEEDEATILRRIVDAFDARATRLGLGDAANPYDVVIVASLIQREAGIDEDRAKIAGVVQNRLARRMPLQIDASVVYARGGGDAPLTDADFARDSPYNTYQVTGLPPTPISTVTAPSLTAALHPAAVPYLYYVLTDADGRHAFAVTYDEHLENIADARRRGVIP